jgi:hypothetical protein
MKHPWLARMVVAALLLGMAGCAAPAGPAASAAGLVDQSQYEHSPSYPRG